MQILVGVEVGELYVDVSVGWEIRSVCGVRWPATTATPVVVCESARQPAACLEFGARDHCDTRSRM